MCTKIYKSVVTSPKSQIVGDGFDHLIAHALSCTLESGVGCAM